VAKCHTFGVFGSRRAFLGIQTTDFKAKKKVSHLSHLSPLSHFEVLPLNCSRTRSAPDKKRRARGLVCLEMAKSEDCRMSWNRHGLDRRSRRKPAARSGRPVSGPADLDAGRNGRDKPPVLCELDWKTPFVASLHRGAGAGSVVTGPGGWTLRALGVAVPESSLGSRGEQVSSSNGES